MAPKFPTVEHRRFCELTGFFGYKPIEAVKEIWPNLTIGSQYNKCTRLLSNAQIVALQDDYSKKLFTDEPARLYKKLLRSSEIILNDPEHRNFGHAKDTILKVMAPALGLDGASQPINVDFNISYTHPEKPTGK